MTNTAPSGTTDWVAIYPTYNQSAGATTINNDLLVDRTETSIGTGTEQNLINLKVAGTSKFKVDNTGKLTITGKIVPRDVSSASNATPTVNTDITDIFRLTAQAANITAWTMSGTPAEGQRLIISITGTSARTITWGAPFEASTIALPATTVTTNMLSCEFVYNSVTSKWRIMATW
jgi:hypothetical protein